MLSLMELALPRACVNDVLDLSGSLAASLFKRENRKKPYST